MLFRSAMQPGEMAHGDLQHGNIIVTSGGPRLVDYDGIYLPELKGMFPGEVGHKHYQHPQRAREHWGPHMDRFSQIALHVGLSAIAQRRELWGKFDNGDNILFTEDDFKNPGASELFGELHNISAIEKMSEEFRGICAGALNKVPTLHEFLRVCEVHGQGCYSLPGGNKYTGGVMDGKADGHGFMTYANGAKYTGEFKGGKRHGQGTLTWPGGDKYTGEWQDGEKYGHGTMTYADGAKYTGESKAGKRNGQGTYTWGNGDMYTGEWRDGVATHKGESAKPGWWDPIEAGIVLVLVCFAMLMYFNSIS